MAPCDCMRKYERPLCGAFGLLGLLQATQDAVIIILVSRYIAYKLESLTIRVLDEQSDIMATNLSVSEHTHYLNTLTFLFYL